MSQSSEPVPRSGNRKGHSKLAREIGSRILRGDYLPGVLLPNEADWCRTFKISRSVVRESIKILSAKGLVISRPKIGTRVEPRQRWNLLDPDILAWYSKVPDKRKFLESIQEMRYIIEPAAAALAARHGNAEQISAITGACADMGRAETLDARIDADIRFHMAILIAAGNEFLLPFGFLIESSLVALFDYVTRQTTHHKVPQRLHESVERAIRRRNPVAARRAVLRLLENIDAVIRRTARSLSGRKAKKKQAVTRSA